MKHIAGLLLVVVLAASVATAQTIYWKRDYVYDSSGNAVAVITPNPSDTTAPDPPTDVGYTAATTTSITLSWTGSTDSGVGLMGYLIYRGAVPVGAVAGTGFTDVGLTPNTTYNYRIVAFDKVFNYSDFSTTAQLLTYTTPASPSGLTATAASTTQINLSWTSPTSGAPDHYGIWRLSGGSWSKINTTSNTTYSDTTVSATTSYVYKISAEDASNTILGGTNLDLATTIFFTDDPITVNSTLVKAVHVTELRTAVDAVRTAAGLGTATWTDSSLSGVQIKALHLNQLRNEVGEAVTLLGLAATNYTDSTLGGVTIKKAHIDELRQRVK